MKVDEAGGEVDRRKVRARDHLTCYEIWVCCADLE